MTEEKNITKLELGHQSLMIVDCTWELDMTVQLELKHSLAGGSELGSVTIPNCTIIQAVGSGCMQDLDPIKNTFLAVNSTGIYDLKRTPMAESFSNFFFTDLVRFIEMNVVDQEWPFTKFGISAKAIHSVE
ncbi:hypothetical protein V1286_004801 [Bradyrhizobium algeriense]|uniref:Uncharacterized protein n=1 Tax=Bradyrhizobium algeriense TaxID=634784 RepID=A0ABU8BGP9_9BRAD